MLTSGFHFLQDGKNGTLIALGWNQIFLLQSAMFIESIEETLSRKYCLSDWRLPVLVAEKLVIRKGMRTTIRLWMPRSLWKVILRSRLITFLDKVRL